MEHDTVVLEGVLADRDSWKAFACPARRALDVVGTRSAMLIMREAYYGARRFEEFSRRVGITDAVASARLRELTDAGLLEKQPYQEPGQRTRHEYRLTQMGIDLMPALLALMQWGSTYLSDRKGGPLAIEHVDCGAPVHVEIRCEAGHEVPIGELGFRVNRRRAQASQRS